MKHLSQREQEVLDLISLEFTTEQIAQELYISHHTVDSHRKSLFKKLGAKNSAGLVRRAFEAGIFQSMIPNSI